MTKKFRVYISVEASVITQDDKSVDWVDENVLDDFNQELVEQGYIVHDMSVEEVTE